MFSFIRGLICATNESDRERSLSAQVDNLEFKIAKLQREKEALEIQKENIERQFSEHKLRDYPAAGSWVGNISMRDLFSPGFQNPVTYVLRDVERLGYDVSAAWMIHRAVNELAMQHQIGAEKIQDAVRQLASMNVEIIN